MQIKNLESHFFRTIILFFITLILMISTSYAEPTKVNGIDHLIKINTANGELYIGSQPNAMALKTLKKDGVRTVINLRQTNEMGQVSTIKHDELGLNLISIPVNLRNLQLRQVTALHNALQDKENYPILLHCASGTRAAILLTLNRIYFDGMSSQAAINEAKQEKLYSPRLQNAVDTFIKQQVLP